METLHDHLVFNTVMSLPEATTQAEAAFQLIGEENGVEPGDLLKRIVKKLEPIKPDDKVQWRVLVPGTDKRADLIALVRQAADGKSEEGFTFYPRPPSSEWSPMVETKWGVTGLLTPEEECELADMTWHYNKENTHRESELQNIKSGALTREEAAELKNATVGTNLDLEQHSKRINELWWRARIGYKLSTKEWEEKREEIIHTLTEIVGGKIATIFNL